MEFCNGTAWTAYGTGGGGGGGLSGCPASYTLVAASSAQGTNAFCINTTIQANSNLAAAMQGCVATGAHICRNRQLSAAITSTALASVTGDSWTGDSYPAASYWNGTANVITLRGCTRANGVAGAYTTNVDPTSGYSSYCCID